MEPAKLGHQRRSTMLISSSSELPRSSSIVFPEGLFAFLLLASCSCFCEPGLGAPTLAPEDAGLHVNQGRSVEKNCSMER
jgi:hypothetical protein